MHILLTSVNNIIIVMEMWNKLHSFEIFLSSMQNRLHLFFMRSGYSLPIQNYTEHFV